MHHVTLLDMYKEVGVKEPYCHMFLVCIKLCVVAIFLGDSHYSCPLKFHINYILYSVELHYIFVQHKTFAYLELRTLVGSEISTSGSFFYSNTSSP